ncbi:MAG: 30S ribosomal protein S7 [Phycisphaerae bacterium]
MGYRRFTASSKQLEPDPKFNSKLLAKFINIMMWDGKKIASQKMVYGALDIIGGKINDATPIEVFEKAIENVKPMLEVRSKRVGGSNYQVPMQVNAKRKQSLAFRWIRDTVRKRGGRPTSVVLANELMAAYRGEGAAMQIRENVHRMAEANKAFAHFAW